MIRTTKLLTLALAATPAFASAQQATTKSTTKQAPAAAPAAAPDDSEDGPDIVVRGARQPGSVIGAGTVVKRKLILAVSSAALVCETVAAAWRAAAAASV